MKIPKTIHQIWIGNKNKAPEKHMNTWKIPGWEYMLWDEEAINEFGLKNRELYDFYYEKEIYHGASDVVRIEVLNYYGGVYIDADTERLKDITPLLKNYDMFAAGDISVRVPNGVIGSVPNHPVLENYIKAMGTAEEVEPAWSTIGGSMFTKMINQYGTNKTHIYPTRTFYPNNKRGEPRKGSEKVYAIHYWGSTGSSPTKYERN